MSKEITSTEARDMVRTLDLIGISITMDLMERGTIREKHNEAILLGLAVIRNALNDSFGLNIDPTEAVTDLFTPKSKVDEKPPVSEVAERMLRDLDL